MAKKFRIMLMIFALGLFVIPKQMLFAQNTEMSCCTGKSSKDCCDSQQKKDDKPCHDSGKKDQKCNGCTSCSSCHFVILLFSRPAELSYIKPVKILTQKEKFTYITPEISDISGKIWQPPKIG